VQNSLAVRTDGFGGIISKDYRKYGDKVIGSNVQEYGTILQDKQLYLTSPQY
jgi:hypothetical protein